MSNKTKQEKKKDFEKLREIKLRRLPLEIPNHRFLEEIRNLPKDTRLIVEDKSLGRRTFIADLYSSKKSRPKFIECICDKEDVYKGPVRFLEEEVEPVDTVKTNCELEFQFWELTGQELRVFQVLTHQGVGLQYKKKGWEGIRNLLSDLRDMKEGPLQVSHLKENGGNISFPLEIEDDYNIIRKKIVNYSLKNDLTVEESIITLYLHDDEFAENYDGLKRFFREKWEEWENVLAPYLPSEENE